MHVPKITGLGPDINASIWPVKDGQWAMGTKMLCENLPEGTGAPSDNLATWTDAKGERYCIRPRTNQSLAPPYSPDNYKPDIDYNHSCALFEIGSDVLIKVKHAPDFWAKSEGAAGKLVQDENEKFKDGAPKIPCPEVLYYWHDEEWERYFVVQRRVHGVSLDSIWFTLTANEKRSMAKEVAEYIELTAKIRSDRFQDAEGGPLEQASFNLAVYQLSEDGNRTPLPIPGPFTHEEFRKHLMKQANGTEPFDTSEKFEPFKDTELSKISKQFCFFHGDLNPDNIIVSKTLGSEEGAGELHVVGFIDWEKAGFVPAWLVPFFFYTPKAFCMLSITEEQFDLTSNLEEFDHPGRQPIPLHLEYQMLLASQLMQRYTKKQHNAFFSWWNEYQAGLHKRMCNQRRTMADL